MSNTSEAILVGLTPKTVALAVSLDESQQESVEFYGTLQPLVVPQF